MPTHDRPMAEPQRRLFWRHHLSRVGGDFRFYCSPCFGDASDDKSKSRRVREVSEELMRRYLDEIDEQTISCSGCGEILVSR